MAQFRPAKIDFSKINNGNKFINSDLIDSEVINAPIESSAYTQALATNAPDLTDVGVVGTPSVEIKEDATGSPHFKFNNLKGEKGEKGDTGEPGKEGPQGKPGIGTGVFAMDVQNGDLILYHSNLESAQFSIGEDGYMIVNIGG